MKLARVVLEQAGYVVVTAEDADGALSRLRASKPRLILMDLQLPGLDGLALTRLLKADPAYRDIIVVAVTAYAMKGDDTKAFAAGCDGYVAKPIDIDNLVEIVARHLEASPGPITG